MGSILQSTPLIKTLRMNYPDVKIIYISTTANSQILQKIPEIDELILIDDRDFFILLKGFFGFVWKLIRSHINIYIDLEVYSNFSSLITLFSMARNRMGFYLNSKNFRLGNYTHMMYYNTRSTIPETYLQFARMLSCDPLIISTISLKSEVTNLQLNEFKSFDLTRERYIAINPNASDLRIERRWDGQSIVQLIRSIRAKYPEYTIFLTGSLNESRYIENLLLSTEIKENLFSLAGKTDISQLISVINYARLFITNDTGPMHISFSTGTKTIALLGPCSPQQYEKYENVRMIYANLYCSPCVHEFIHPPCKGNNLCMKAITPDEVFLDVEKLLQSGNDLKDFNEVGMKFNVDLSGREYIAGAIHP